jgi:hypothetical protein
VIWEGVVQVLEICGMLLGLDGEELGFKLSIFWIRLYPSFGLGSQARGCSSARIHMESEPPVEEGELALFKFPEAV